MLVRCGPPPGRGRSHSGDGDFLMWKDADPDIPIVKQAKAEYVRLQ
jgi:hypothetical protein